MLLAAVTADNVTIAAAFLAGIVSFLSPCVLPIVPGYLSLVTGVSVAELDDPDARRMRQIVWNTVLFVAGFTFVFVGLGLASTSLGSLLTENQDLLTRLAGAVMIAMACYLAGSQILMRPGLYRDVRFHPHLERFGVFASPVAGAAFAFGWTPCLGPVLAAVLTVASTQSDAWRGGVLLLAYSLGLGVPFLVVGTLMGRLTGALGWFKRHGRVITFVSAAVLGAFGVILLFDQLPWVTGRLREAADAVGLGWLINLG